VNTTTNEVTGQRAAETQAARVRCLATTRAGVTCGGWALKGDTFCWAHSAAVAERRKAGQKRGGQITSNRMRGLLGLVDFADPKGPNRFREALVREAVRAPALMPSARARDLSAIAKDAEESNRGVDLDERLSAAETRLSEIVIRSGEVGEE